MDCAAGEIWKHNNEMSVWAMQIEDSIEGDQESREKNTNTISFYASFHYQALFKQIKWNGNEKIFTSNE